MINVCVSRIPECCIEVTEQCIVGDTISNSLILTELAAASVARGMIDREQYDRDIINYQGSLHPYFKPGSLIEVTDKENGTYHGRLNKFSFTIEKKKNGQLSARTNLEIERIKP